MKLILEYLSALRDWITISKNWYVIPLVSLKVKRNDIYLKLRNGLNLKVINKGKDSDTVVVRDLCVNKPYTKDNFTIKDNNCVIDIGANVGIWSTLVAISAKNVKVFSYEPHPKNFQYLKYNILHNGLQDKIKFFNLAVGGKKGKIKLYVHDRGSGGHSVYSYRVISKDHSFIEVLLTTLKEIFIKNKLGKIDLLKLDCEGSEYDILFNTPKAYLHKIKKIVLEYHTVLGYSIQQLEDFLRKNGFRSRNRGGIIYAWRN